MLVLGVFRRHHQMSLKFKKVENIRKGGGSSLFWKMFKIFLFFNYQTFPYFGVQIILINC